MRLSDTYIQEEYYVASCLFKVVLTVRAVIPLHNLYIAHGGLRQDWEVQRKREKVIEDHHSLALAMEFYKKEEQKLLALALLYYCK